MILAALGGASWLIAERRTSRHAIEIDLQEAARLQGKSRWSEAQTALERARGRLGDRGFSDLRNLLERADRDQQAAARFDKIRSNRAISEGRQLPFHAPWPNTNRRFAISGSAHRGDDPALVASRIQRSNIHAILISAIEDWAAITEDQA